MGQLEDCISARERAFAAYVEAGDRRRAAIVAIALAKDYYFKRASAIGTAWVNRAERLLSEEPDCGEHGHLERLRGVIAYEGAGDYGKALEHAERALEIATRFGDRNLQAIALHDRDGRSPPRDVWTRAWLSWTRRPSPRSPASSRRTKRGSFTATPSALARSSRTIGARAIGRKRRSGGANAKRSRGFRGCAAYTALQSSSCAARGSRPSARRGGRATSSGPST
jgi:tetratricopeptide (TPR) repeat protein